MTKTYDILIIAFAIIIVSVILFGTFLLFHEHKKYSERSNDESELVSEAKLENSPNSKLDEFLENPIDLLTFKQKKGIEFTTSVTNGTEYYYIPKILDSIFYTYYYPNFEKKSNRINKFVVFKHGENKHSYDDVTETLIEFRIFNLDSDLEKANLFGLSKTELESKFGSDYLTLDNGIAYTYKNKVLIIELIDTKVQSFNYIKLNTDNIDRNLVERIVK